MSREGWRPPRHPLGVSGLSRMDTRCLAQAGTIKRCSTIAPACLPPRKGTTTCPDIPQRGQAVIQGSDVFAPKWERVEGSESVFRGVLDPAMFQGANPFHRNISINGSDTSKQVRPAQGELEEVLGEVFVQGQPYAQVIRLADLRKQERSWMVPEDGKSILVHFPKATEPSRCLVEITTRNRIFAPQRRGLGYIHVKGFVVEHCANQGPFPQGGAVSVRSGHDWVIEGNTIRFATTIGLDCGSETWDGKGLTDTAPEEQRVMIGGRHLIRDNDVTDNGLCGIAGWNHSGTRILLNRVERNAARSEAGREARLLRRKLRKSRDGMSFL